jgi:hypothetical protein
MKDFYRELSCFWDFPDIEISISLSRCFRCILNGGSNPYVLRADLVQWESDGTKTQVTDKVFLQDIVRESLAIDKIIEDFGRAMNSVGEGMTEFRPIASVEREDGVGLSGANNSLENIAAMSSTVPSISDSKAVSQSSIQEWVITLLDLCIDLSTNSKSAAYMCRHGLCRGAIIFLNEFAAKNFRNPKVALSVELLWTCLENYILLAEQMFNINRQVALLIDVVDFEFSLNVFKDVLFKIIHQGYRLADKELRNELVIVLTLLARFPRSTPAFLQSGMLNLLLTYSTVAECGKSGWSFYMQPIAKIRNFGSIFDIDLEFKRHLWSLISDLMGKDDEDVITSVAASPLIDMLLTYLEHSTIPPEHQSLAHRVHGSESSLHKSLLPKEKPTKELTGLAATFLQRAQSADMDTKPDGGDGDPSSIRKHTLAFVSALSVHQLMEFQVVAVVFLAEHGCRLIGEFLRIDGPVRILETIHIYWRSNLDRHRIILFHAMILLNKCVLSLPSVVKPLLEYQEIINVLLQIFSGVDEEFIRSQAARLISNLCRNSQTSVKHLRNFHGIKLLVRSITGYCAEKRVQVGKKAGIKISGEETSAELDEEELKPGGDITIFIISIIDCVQNGIVHSEKNESQFAQEEGIDALLDLLEVSPFLLRLKVLRLLADILENSSLASFAHAWRSSQTMRSAAQIFCHCWQDEEARLGYPRNQGILTNLFDPLRGHAWPIKQLGQTAASIFDNSSTTSVSLLAKTKLEMTPADPGGVSYEIRLKVMQSDSRCILAEILGLLGLLDHEHCFASSGGNNHEGAEMSPVQKLASSSELGLSPSEKQVLSVAKRYNVLLRGEFWREVNDELEARDIVPVDADQTQIQFYIRESFLAASMVQLEHFELQDHDKDTKRAESDQFIGGILDQKNKQIKAEWIKRNSLKKMKKQPGSGDTHHHVHHAHGHDSS